jgi:biopolymer transport protein ExbD
MRFKHRLQLEYGLKQIVIAPLINMLFLLLAFFMLVTNFIIQPGTRINLPRVITSEVADYKNIEILISGENTFYLNGTVVTAQELRRYLMQLSKRKQPILVKADRRASLDKVAEIWDMCKELGITQLNIATNQ